MAWHNDWLSRRWLKRLGQLLDTLHDFLLSNAAFCILWICWLLRYDSYFMLFACFLNLINPGCLNA